MYLLDPFCNNDRFTVFRSCNKHVKNHDQFLYAVREIQIEPKLSCAFQVVYDYNWSPFQEEVGGSGIWARFQLIREFKVAWVMYKAHLTNSSYRDEILSCKTKVIIYFFKSKCWQNVKKNKFSYTVGKNVNFDNYKWKNSMEAPPQIKCKVITFNKINQH